MYGCFEFHHYLIMSIFLGKVQAGKDVVLFISHSGNTEECVIAAKKLIEKEVTTLTITSKRGIVNTMKLAAS